MIRKVKTLGIALVAVFALTAVAASAASAANFTAASYPATAEGGQKTSHVFTVEGSEVTCSTANFSTTMSAAANSADVTPSYSGCKAFGFVNATVEMNGCKYRFHVGSGSGDEYTGTTDVVCEGSNTIRVHAGTCTTRIGSQSGLGSVTLKNVTGSPNKIEAVANVSGIEVNVTESGFLCPLEEGVNSTGAYTGSTLMAGNGGVSIDIG